MHACYRVAAVAILVSWIPCGTLVEAAWAAAPASTTDRSPASADPGDARLVVGSVGVGHPVAPTLDGPRLRELIRQSQIERVVPMVDGGAGRLEGGYTEMQQVGSPSPNQRAKRLKMIAVVAGVAVAGAVLLRGIKEYRDIPK